ncbi:MAG: hypothetical protein HOJ90_08410 [Alphaproteobacteria bacterium]|jgi:VanZ family protein|nr:hypothetical protein [Alphaproteobacteria bacterium]
MIRLPHPVFTFAYVAAMLVVIVLSLIPSPDIPGPEGSDKAAHLIAYGAIAFCGGLGFQTWPSRLKSAAFAIALGVFLEFAQAAWFERNGSAWDAVANSLGAALGLVGAALILSLAVKLSRKNAA